MKGVICKAVAELVRTKFGENKWEEILEKSGLPKDTEFQIAEDVADKKVMEVLNNLCDVLGITFQQAADAFGEYWVCEFAPKVYKKYYEGVNSAKDYLLMMDKAHSDATLTMAGAQPPRFTYEWKDEKTLIMGYKSHRNLIDIMIGLIKGAGKYFNEKLEVKKLSDKEVEIKFP